MASKTQSSVRKEARWTVSPKHVVCQQQVQIVEENSLVKLFSGKIQQIATCQKKMKLRAENFCPPLQKKKRARITSPAVRLTHASQVGAEARLLFCMRQIQLLSECAVDLLVVVVVSGHPQPSHRRACAQWFGCGPSTASPANQAPVYCGCPAGTHGCDPVSRVRLDQSANRFHTLVVCSPTTIDRFVCARVARTLVYPMKVPCSKIQDVLHRVHCPSHCARIVESLSQVCARADQSSVDICLPVSESHSMPIFSRSLHTQAATVGDEFP